MKSRFMIGAGAAAIAIVSASGLITVNQSATPFINPIITAQSICGDSGQMQRRRAFFLSMAKAYAAKQDTDTVATKIPDGQIGNIEYEISTSSKAAQSLFNRGVAFMWNFNHEEAIKMFREAQQKDRDCAMCYWGEAFALGPNINAPMDPAANMPAWEAVQKAMSLRDNASEKERALVTALNYRYSKRPPSDRAKLDEAFAQQMGDVATKFPDDDFIAVTAAEANMDMQAWDYWEADKKTPKRRTSQTISLLEAVLARNPDYQPAIHLYIHITEATTNPYRAKPYADKLASLSPGLGHLIHMPSHTYFKIGEFRKSLDANIAAVAADEDFIASGDASVLYEFGYYTHNVHFVLTSAQMAGDRETALAMARKLDAKLPADMAAAVPFAQPIKAAPMFAMAQFEEPSVIMSVEKPSVETPFLQGAWRYMRGEALARENRTVEARAEAAAIGALINGSDMSSLEQNGIPALDIMRIAQRVIIARASMADDDYDSAVEALEEAVALQDGLPYTEPPYWYYPIKQTLAAALLRKGEADRAEQLFIEALAENPNNGWVLFGLAESYQAQDENAGKRFAEGLFKEAWIGDRDFISLDRL